MSTAILIIACNYISLNLPANLIFKHTCAVISTVLFKESTVLECLLGCHLLPVLLFVEFLFHVILAQAMQISAEVSYINHRQPADP